MSNTANYNSEACLILQCTSKCYSRLYLHCVSKKLGPPTFSTVTLKPIVRFWLFLAWIFRTQLAIKWLFSFAPHSTFVSALPGENTTSKISLFHQTRYDCLINITRKKHILFTFLTLWLTFHPVVHFLTACSKTAWSAGSLCAHNQGDAFSIHRQQYR